MQEGIKIIIVLVDNHGFRQHRRAEPVAGARRIRHQLSGSAPRSRGNWMASA